MHPCPSYSVHCFKTHSPFKTHAGIHRPKARDAKRNWLPVALAGAALLAVVLAWRGLRVYEPRPRQAAEPPEEAASLNY
jgi:hypothetical protein